MQKNPNNRGSVSSTSTTTEDDEESTTAVPTKQTNKKQDAAAPITAPPTNKGPEGQVQQQAQFQQQTQFQQQAPYQANNIQGQQEIQQQISNNPCCCDCMLHEGVGWISGLEFVWGILFAIHALSLIGTIENAKQRLALSSFLDYSVDRGWVQYGEKYMSALIIASVFHIAECVLSVFLMAASSRRIRGMCFFWIISIALISVGEIAVVVLYPIPTTYIMIVIIPFRFYFAYIVFALASEIVLYPNGAPIRMITSPSGLQMPTQVYQPAGPVVVAQPVYYPYGGYYGSPYGYGYPYGHYYNTDAALAGIAIGSALGGYHHHCYDGYSDFCY